jgi:hypothetical protein
MDRGDPLQLLVIPPDTAPAPAERAMAMAAAGKDAARPTDILTAANATTQVPSQRRVEGGQHDDQEHAWENEGGRTGAGARQATATGSVG